MDPALSELKRGQGGGTPKPPPGHRSTADARGRLRLWFLHTPRHLMFPASLCLLGSNAWKGKEIEWTDAGTWGQWRTGTMHGTPTQLWLVAGTSTYLL